MNDLNFLGKELRTFAFLHGCFLFVISYAFSPEYSERNIEVPIRNDHDLTSASQEGMVSRVTTITVDLPPTSEIGSRYSDMSISWGGRPRFRVDTRIEVNDHHEQKEWCKLCEKLDVKLEKLSLDNMFMHMLAK